MVQRKNKSQRAPTSPTEPPDVDDTTEKSQDLQKKLFRAEFAITSSKTTFLASQALRDLYVKLKEVDHKMNFYTIDGNTEMRQPSDFPQKEEVFNKQFTTTPHLSQKGGGQIHIKFCLALNSSFDNLKRNTSLIQYLKDNQIWLTEHKFNTDHLTTAGILLNKSPTITNRPHFEQELRERLGEYYPLTFPSILMPKTTKHPQRFPQPTLPMKKKPCKDLT